MKETIYSPLFLRKRKFFVFLPVFVVPFVILLFYLLGGGSSARNAGITHQATGDLNAQLPDAHNTEHSGWTKLDYYKQADADSAKRKAQRTRDPYYKLHAMADDTMDSNGLRAVGHQRAADIRADQLTRQLERFNRQLKPVAKKPVEQEIAGSVSPDVQKLAAMMLRMNSHPNNADPEIEKLDGMLEKIMAIQHPELTEKQIQDSLQKQQGKIFTVGAPDENAISTIGDSNTLAVSANGFYSIDEMASNAEVKNAFAALIAENQTLVSGAIIKLRLAQDLEVNGVTVPADQLVYGAVHLDGERLEVSINSIRIGQQLLPVKLSVYDLDGLSGIAIPGAITRDVMKQSAGQSMQNIGMLSVDPSIGAQAASAGIQAAKTLLHKKIQLTKVMVTAGYEVLLKNDERVH
jgi:conjugative transposon TraM protein